MKKIPWPATWPLPKRVEPSTETLPDTRPPLTYEDLVATVNKLRAADKKEPFIEMGHE